MNRGRLGVIAVFGLFSALCSVFPWQSILLGLILTLVLAWSARGGEEFTPTVMAIFFITFFGTAFCLGRCSFFGFCTTLGFGKGVVFGLTFCLAGILMLVYFLAINWPLIINSAPKKKKTQSSETSRLSIFLPADQYEELMQGWEERLWRIEDIEDAALRETAMCEFKGEQCRDIPAALWHASLHWVSVWLSSLGLRKARR